MEIILTAIIVCYCIATAVVLVVVGGAAKRNDQKIAEWKKLYSTDMKQAQSYTNALEDMNAKLQKENSALLEKVKALESKVAAKEAPEEEKEQLPDKEAVPDGLTNRHLYMDYQKITNKKSEQWKIQEKCYTSPATGARYIDCDCGKVYTVALAANYGRTLGDCWLVKLDNGNCFYIMLAEYKDDGKDPLRMGDTCKNFEGEDVTNVIEFIVDEYAMPSYIRQNGSLSAHPFFDGNIEKMFYLGYFDWKE